MADIFDEVSEELKQDQLIKTWKKYSKLIGCLFVIIIITIISYQVYINWNKIHKINIFRNSNDLIVVLQKS